jgi:hypothetical protein
MVLELHYQYKLIQTLRSYYFDTIIGQQKIFIEMKTPQSKYLILIILNQIYLKECDYFYKE